jgi:hypothetical protein
MFLKKQYDHAIRDWQGNYYSFGKKTHGNFWQPDINKAYKYTKNEAKNMSVNLGCKAVKI